MLSLFGEIFKRNFIVIGGQYLDHLTTVVLKDGMNN